MSSKVTTWTPFINKEMLIKALRDLNCLQSVEGNDILTNRSDYSGNQRFVLSNGKYLFQHEKNQFLLRNYSSEQHRDVHDFIGTVEKQYNALCRQVQEAAERAKQEQERLRREAEKCRLEAERLRRLEAEQKQREEAERLRLERERALQEQARLEAERLSQEAEARRLEAERLRMERERQAFVQAQKERVIAKAKEQGYTVREERVAQKVKLVLVRHTY
jgi:hypothetical protein